MRAVEATAAWGGRRATASARLSPGSAIRPDAGRTSSANASSPTAGCPDDPNFTDVDVDVGVRPAGPEPPPPS